MSHSYTPSFDDPYTINLTVENDLTVSGTLNANILNISEIHAQSGAFQSISSDNIDTVTIQAQILTSSTGVFTSLDSSSILSTSIETTSLISSTASIDVLSSGTGAFQHLSAEEILINTQYCNDSGPNARDIQDGINAASSGQVIALSPGSFSGSTVTIDNKSNIAIIGPPRGQGSICELSGGRALTIASNSSGITIANLQIEGLFTLGSTGNNYFTNLQCLSGLTIASGSSGNYFFKDCEFSGLIQTPVNFSGLLTFAECNFAGATFLLQQSSPLQVQFTLSLNLPPTRPVNATYGGTNADTNLQITLDAQIINSENITTLDLNADSVYSSTGSFVDLSTTSLSSSTASITELSSSTGVFSSGIDTQDLHAVNATIDNLTIASITVPTVVASTGIFDNVLINSTLDVDTINVNHLNITPASGSQNLLNGWWMSTTKSYLVAPFISLTGPSGFESLPNDGSLDNCKYIYIDCVTNYPDISIKFYPTLYNDSFEALYREQLYSVCEKDPNTILFKYAPDTADFDATDCLDFLNSFIQGSNSLGVSNFTLQQDTNLLLANLNYIQTGYYDNVYTAVLERTTEPQLIPFDRTALKLKQYSTPEQIFNYYDDMARLNYGLYNPKGSTPERNDSYYIDYGRNLAKKKAYFDGITHQYTVSHIVASTTVQNDAGFGPTSPTGITKIHFNTHHLITEGSTIRISGLSGDWSVLNGVHTNDVVYSFDYDPITNNDNNHMDQNTLPLYAYGICLKYDSSSLPQVNTGPSLGYAIYSGNNVRVSVTHKITADITYNNFIAALLAYHRETYGTTEHAGLSYLISDSGDGRVLSDWNEISYLPYQASKQNYMIPLGVSKLYNTQYSLADEWIPCDHYNIVDKFINVVPGYENGQNIAQNYMESNELYQLFYAITGPLTTAIDDETSLIRETQIQICDLYGVPHGSQIQFTHGLKGSTPPVGFIPLGLSPLDPDQHAADNMLTFGIVSSNLSTGCGYIGMTLSLPCWSETSTLIWLSRAFFPVGQTYQDQFNHPDIWTGLWAQPISFIMRWFAGQSPSIDRLILDSIGNFGGYPDYISQCIGENRYSFNSTSLFDNVDNSRSSLDNIYNYSSYGKPVEEHPLLNCSYIESTYGADSVFNPTGGRVIYLTSESSYSAANLMVHNLLGNDQDGIISANLSTKRLGQQKGYFGGTSTNLCFLPNNVFGNLSDTILYTAITGEGQAENLYSINTALELKALNHISDVTDVSSNTAEIKGSSGTAFKGGIENTIYMDFGFCENPRPVLSGWTHPQTPDVNDPQTWRHSYLEGCISEINKVSW